MRRRRYVSNLGETKMHERFWLENVKEISHLETLGIEEMMILKRILKK
jgi:hypothetical protein